MNFDDHEEMPELHPAWRQAKRDFFAQGFTLDDVIPFAWFYQAFRIEMPSPETSMQVAERAKLAFLSQFKPFEDALLYDHNVALCSVRGVGYRIVPPHEQTAWAEKSGLSEMKRATKKMGSRMANVDLTKLSSQQRRENSNARAHWGNIKVMLSDMTAQRPRSDTEKPE